MVEPEKKALRPIPALDDACQRPASTISDLPRYDALDQRKAPPGEYWNEISIEKEAHGKVSLGFELSGNVPLQLGFDYVRTASEKTTIRTLLAPGASYVAYAPNRDGTLVDKQIEICWTTKA